ncbi:MAG TPA: hypothetical protein VFJ85_06405 [Acidimicrobiales bacterium]|nr:hypothetical protein [Acidimicrobiales bacterium]
MKTFGRRIGMSAAGLAGSAMLVVATAVPASACHNAGVADLTGPGVTGKAVAGCTWTSPHCQISASASGDLPAGTYAVSASSVNGAEVAVCSFESQGSAGGCAGEFPIDQCVNLGGLVYVRNGSGSVVASGVFQVP